jgi:hypothetical protein
MTTLKQIDGEIAKFATSAAALNVQCHAVAMMIYLHAAPKDVGPDCEGTGDCTRAVKLVRAMPASFRRTMMIDWFAKNSPIRIKLSDTGDKCQYDPKYSKLTAEEKLACWNLENANTEPFYDLADKTPEEKIFNLAAMIKFVESIGKRVEKSIEKGEIPADDMATALALQTKLQALKVVPVKVKADNNDEEAAAELKVG